jgi:chemotaxis signal transduction protein
MDAALQTGGDAAALLAPFDALTQGFVWPAPRESVATPAAAPAESTLRQGLRVGHLQLMIRYEDGSSLTELPPVRRLPNSPAWFIGMANLNGALIPVFDLANYLGADATEPTRPMLLVLGHGDDAAGIVIDGLPQRLRPLRADRLPDAPLPTALAGCVGPTCWAADSLWIDLRVGALLQRLGDDLAARTTDRSITSPES